MKPTDNIREIKFRAWDIFNKRMIYEPYKFRKSHEDESLSAPYQYYGTWENVYHGISRPCFIMQFIGLKAKNEKDIYEGDLLIFDKRNAICVVEFRNAEFQAKTPFGNYWRVYSKTSLKNRPENIGNIYENHELL